MKSVVINLQRRINLCFPSNKMLILIDLAPLSEGETPKNSQFWSFKVKEHQLLALSRLKVIEKY